MEIKVEIKRLNDLIRAFERAPDEVKREMQLALRVALRDVQRRARAEHRFRTRTGNLERSITTKVLSDWPVRGLVALDPAVTRTADGRSYGVMVHDGTRAHTIRPRFKRSLRWPDNSEFIFARRVRHPGTKPDPFLYKAAENERANINATFERYTLRALQKAGIT